MMKQHKQFRGSVLVFALLVLSIFLSIALSTAGIVISDKNSSRATEKSTLAFQIADGAAENVLKRVYKNTDATLNDLTQNLYSNLEQGTQGRPQCNVSSGTISGSLPSASSGRYEVTFFDGNGAPLACGSTTWRTDVKRIVSSGTFGGATRAIDVSIRPAPCGGVATVTDTRGTNVTYDTVEIGNQCWMQQNMRVGNTLPPSTPSADNGIIEKYCYGNNAANCSNNGNPTYPDGGLYTWDEAMQYSTTEGAQGICPTDWHIPTNAQWYELEQFTDATVVPNAAYVNIIGAFDPTVILR